MWSKDSNINRVLDTFKGVVMTLNAIPYVLNKVGFNVGLKRNVIERLQGVYDELKDLPTIEDIKSDLFSNSDTFEMQRLQMMRLAKEFEGVGFESSIMTDEPYKGLFDSINNANVPCLEDGERNELLSYARLIVDFCQVWVIQLKDFIDTYKRGELKAKSLKIEPQPKGLELPDEVNTQKAQKTFAKAIENGWMVKKPEGGFEWLGIDKKGSKAQLSYLCAKVYGYQYREGKGNIGEKVPYEALERLFNVKRLDRAMQQTFEAVKPQRWREKIDQIITE